MIGAVIDLMGVSKSSLDCLFHVLNHKPVLEHVLTHCLKSKQLHKVIVLAPQRLSIYLSGSLFRSSLVNASSTINGRHAQIFYGDESATAIESLWSAAATHGLTTIVKLDGDCPLLPTWLLNEVLAFYGSAGSNRYLSTTSGGYDPGLGVEVFPFWLLAKAAIEEPTAVLTEYLRRGEFLYFSNAQSAPTYVPPLEGGFRFSDLSRAPLFERLLTDLESGFDISDAVQEAQSDAG